VVRHSSPVLLDTNVILEAHRTSSWKALSGGYGIETVETCVIETQTGFQRRRMELQIDETELRARVVAVHKVADIQRAEVLIRSPDIALDPGERDLWAHAMRRHDAWVLCGPDRASLRFGVRLGFRDRFVSLERLLEDAGFGARGRLRVNYTTRWLASTLNELAIAERGKS
jgi:hypothetical protein